MEKRGLGKDHANAFVSDAWLSKRLYRVRVCVSSENASSSTAGNNADGCSGTLGCMTSVFILH